MNLTRRSNIINDSWNQLMWNCQGILYQFARNISFAGLKFMYLIEPSNLVDLVTSSSTKCLLLSITHIEGILQKGPYPPCLRMADRALLAGYPRHEVRHSYPHVSCVLLCWIFMDRFIHNLHDCFADNGDNNLKKTQSEVFCSTRTSEEITKQKPWVRRTKGFSLGDFWGGSGWTEYRTSVVFVFIPRFLEFISSVELFLLSYCHLPKVFHQ